MPMTARERLELILDEGWELLFDQVVGGDPLSFPGYPEQLEAARARTGESESVLVAAGSVDGIAIIAIAFEFGFLGGSMGVAAGERICRAFERAASDLVPVVALCASGGARMQEGMLALAQMPATIGERARLSDAKQPFIAYLCNPTTGGVFASFASTADSIWAEPGATVGFAGPRVAEAVTGEPLPAGSHTVVNALAKGLIDDIVEPGALRGRLVQRLRSTRAPERGAGAPAVDDAERSGLDAWQQVQIARHPARPTGTFYAEPFERRVSRGGTTIRCGVVTIEGHRVVAIAQDRRARQGRPTPDDFRRARLAIAHAERDGLPLVTFIDTPGADPGGGSEADAIASEIAETFRALLAAIVPTVAVVVGEGGSGGALALAACDRVLIQQNAIFSVIGPEGAAAILRRTDLQGVARDLRLTAHDLRDAGLADGVITEPPGGAHADPAVARAHTLTVVAATLAAIPVSDERRSARWRALGRTL